VLVQLLSHFVIKAKMHLSILNMEIQLLLRGNSHKMVVVFIKSNRKKVNDDFVDLC